MIRTFKIAFAIAMVFSLASSSVRADLVNGGFETGDLSGWDILGAVTNESASFGITPYEGTRQALLTANEVSPSTAAVEGHLGLTDLDGIFGRDAFNGAALQTLDTFTVSANDKLRFRWKFLTDDFVSDDFAFWTLTGPDNVAQLLANSVLPVVPLISTTPPTPFARETDSSSMSDPSTWGFVEYTFATGGDYRLGFGVMNTDDEVDNSGLLVDSIELLQTASVPEPSSLALMGFSAAALSLMRRRRQATPKSA